MKRKYERSGPDVNPRRHIEAEKNQSTQESPSFKKACEAAGIPVTRRQASKFRKKRGLAYASV